MSKIAIIADCHIGPARLPGVPPRVVEGIRIAALNKAFRHFSETGIDAVVIAGDLFDRVALSPRFVMAVNGCLHSNPISTYILAGNHDTRTGETALWYVNRASGIVLHPTSKTPRVIAPAPWIQGQSAEGVIRKALYSHRDAKTLVGHVGLYSGEAPPWVVDDPWFLSVHQVAELVKKSSVKTVVCGHGHKWLDVEIDGVRIIQVGSLTPCNRAESGPGFGNYVVVDGHNSKHAIGAIPGMRYSADGESIKGCWTIVDSDITDDPPFSWQDALGTTTRVAFSKARKGRAVDIKSEDAISASLSRAVLRTVRRGDIKGPIRGLVAEAMGRLRGGYTPRLVLPVEDPFS